MVGTSSSTENQEDTPGAVAQRLHDEQLQAELQELENSPSTGTDEVDDFGDPDPPPVTATSDQKLEYSRAVNHYSKEILDHLREITSLKGEELWIEYTCSFRKQTIKAMSSTQQIDWARFLRSRGVSVLHKRGKSRWKALQDCLEAKEFIPATEQNDDARKTSTADPPNQPSFSHTTRSTHKSPNKDLPSVCGVEEENKDDKNSNKHSVNFRTHGPSGSANFRTHGPSSTSHGFSRRGQLESLMKAYQSQTKYSGSFVEDFEGAIEQFNTICVMLELSEEDKAKGFPIMLTGAAFSRYSRQYARKELTYKELIDAFRTWYTSEEQKKRLLNIWQTPSLTKELQLSPEKSELEVFQKLSDKLVRVQNQLHRDYHHDRFLRDQLIRAADIPHLQHSLNDKVPSSAQEAMHRFANRLSAEPRSAGANIAMEGDDQAKYGLGMKYGGKARKTLKGSNHQSSRKKAFKAFGLCKRMLRLWRCSQSSTGTHPERNIVCN